MSIENIPRSVIIAIKAAAKDVVASVKGGAYEPVSTDKLANTLEKFMIGMVAQSYPRVKSAWLDKDIDVSWVKTAEGILSGEEIDGLINKAFPGVDPTTEGFAVLQRFYSSKLYGKTMADASKAAPDLFKTKEPGLPLGDKPMGATPPPTDTPKPGEENHTTPLKPLPGKPLGKKPLKKEIPDVQERNKAGDMKTRSPLEEEFEKGIPTTTKI